MTGKNQKIATVRTEAHQLIDDLPETDIHLILRVIKGLKATSDPLQYLLENAPYDDKTLTEEEHRACEEARTEADRNEVISHQEIVKEFGLAN